MARRHHRDYSPSKRVKAAWKRWRGENGYCPLKTFAATENGELRKVCRDWLHNKVNG